MKKLFVFSVLVVVFVGFTACGGSDKKSDECEILTFKVGSQEYTVGSNSVSWIYTKTGADAWAGFPTGTVIPTITISKGATIEPPMGTSVNLETGVTYKVTAEDGKSYKQYSAKAEKGTNSF